MMTFIEEAVIQFMITEWKKVESSLNLNEIAMLVHLTKYDPSVAYSLCQKGLLESIGYENFVSTPEGNRVCGVIRWWFAHCNTAYY